MVMVPGLGIRSCHQLLRHVDDPRSLMNLKARDLAGLGLPRDLAEVLVSREAADRVEAEWSRAGGLGIRIIDIEDPVYPRLLLETSDPPLVLYLRGDQWSPHSPHVAVVGVRRASPYGLDCAEHLASELAARGVIVVSGLARGIDTAAHRGALEAGSTVAVLGTGADRIYPRENRRLAETIVGKGALLSEFPLGTPPLPAHFPLRNRILAGMTAGTVVVEAARRSGSLITARAALDSNREVFAVPGPIQSEGSEGPHSLIREGACLVRGIGDIIEELPEWVRAVAGPQPSPGAVAGPATNEFEVAASLTPAAGKVRQALSPSDPTPIDILLARVGLPAGDLYDALLELELAGLVRQLPGDRYVLRIKQPRTKNF
jgi:DNA processing protein